ncbi:hypothetical protein [Sphingomonas sp. 28-63-12]|uniref:hypothetical protein n=1 Tax=Sphingomonas sp. 28-63-12 TaxID=1970434 RepID=UPI000BCA457C|nr:MAG: hypothetical protein B7Y47_08505 [Sphingomonas sp. 28-63-12]
MLGFQIGETAELKRFGAICDTSAIPDERAAFFIKLMLPVQTDRFSCHQHNHRFALSWVAFTAASSKGWRKVTWRLSAHQCAEADTRFELGAVAAVDPVYAIREQQHDRPLVTDVVVRPLDGNQSAMSLKRTIGSLC